MPATQLAGHTALHIVNLLSQPMLVYRRLLDSYKRTTGTSDSMNIYITNVVG